MEWKYIISDNYMINESFESAIMSIISEKGWNFTDNDFMILGKVVNDILHLYPKSMEVEMNYNLIYGVVYLTIIDYYLDKKYPGMNLIFRLYQNKN